MNVSCLAALLPWLRIAAGNMRRLRLLSRYNTAVHSYIDDGKPAPSDIDREKSKDFWLALANQRLDKVRSFVLDTLIIL
jgi:hypothetical protein